MFLTIKSIDESHYDWIKAFSADHWGAESVVSRGVSHNLTALPGFVVYQNHEIVGLATYHINDADCELVTINSLKESQGIGSMLIGAVLAEARKNLCQRVWLVTTNDNLNALKFYQKRGFELVAIHRYAVNEARKIKPEIPTVGMHDIPLRDEIEMEYRLS